MTALLGQIERLLERAFEGPTQRLFRTRLQPVELARAIARAMAAEAQIEPGGLLIPNQYRVALHPNDFRRYAGTRAALERDLATHVLQQAQRRGWRCPGWPEVELVAADDVAVGRARVSASWVDRPPEASVLPAAIEPVPGTAVFPVPSPSRARPTSRGRSAWVELADGRRQPLDDHGLSIGRARDNDLVLDHDSVSRHHAEIRRVGRAYVLVDLGSTNGTRVDGQPVGEQPLSPGAAIEVGAVALRFGVAS